MKDEMFNFYKNALCGAITAPLCADYKNEWRGCGQDKDKLVRLVMRQQSLPYFITHCNDGKGLSKEYILETFQEYINNDEKAVIKDADNVSGYTYNLYVAFDGIFKAAADVLAFMWCSNTNVTIQSVKSPVLYVGCNTTLHIDCEGYNSPYIYLFDNSKVILDNVDETCKVVVYKYSDDAQVIIGDDCTSEQIKEFRKELRL